MATATEGNKPMTKGELTSHFAKKFSLTKAQVNAFFDELASLAAVEAQRGFILPGLGKLVMVNRNARMGRNPKTGEAIMIPAKTVLKFRIAKACKDAVLGSQ
jgi:DNA-binding protein HU-beta